MADISIDDLITQMTAPDGLGGDMKEHLIKALRKLVPRARARAESKCPTDHPFQEGIRLIHTPIAKVIGNRVHCDPAVSDVVATVFVNSILSEGGSAGRVQMEKMSYDGLTITGYRMGQARPKLYTPKKIKDHWLLWAGPEETSPADLSKVDSCFVERCRFQPGRCLVTYWSYNIGGRMVGRRREGGSPVCFDCLTVAPNHVSQVMSLIAELGIKGTFTQVCPLDMFNGLVQTRTKKAAGKKETSLQVFAVMEGISVEVQSVQHKLKTKGNPLLLGQWMMGEEMSVSTLSAAPPIVENAQVLSKWYAELLAKTDQGEHPPGLPPILTMKKVIKPKYIKQTPRITRVNRVLFSSVRASNEADLRLLSKRRWNEDDLFITTAGVTLKTSTVDEFPPCLFKEGLFGRLLMLAASVELPVSVIRAWAENETDIEETAKIPIERLTLYQYAVIRAFILNKLKLFPSSVGPSKLSNLLCFETPWLAKQVKQVHHREKLSLEAFRNPPELIIFHWIGKVHIPTGVLGRIKVIQEQLTSGNLLEAAVAAMETVPRSPKKRAHILDPEDDPQPKRQRLEEFDMEEMEEAQAAVEAEILAREAKKPTVRVRAPVRAGEVKPPVRTPVKPPRKPRGPRVKTTPINSGPKKPKSREFIEESDEEEAAVAVVAATDVEAQIEAQIEAQVAAGPVDSTIDDELSQELGLAPRQESVYYTPDHSPSLDESIPDDYQPPPPVKADSAIPSEDYSVTIINAAIQNMLGDCPPADDEPGGEDDPVHWRQWQI